MFLFNNPRKPSGRNLRNVSSERSRQPAARRIPFDARITIVKDPERLQLHKYGVVGLRDRSEAESQRLAADLEAQRQRLRQTTGGRPWRSTRWDNRLPGKRRFGTVGSYAVRSAAPAM